MVTFAEKSWMCRKNNNLAANNANNINNTKYTKLKMCFFRALCVIRGKSIFFQEMLDKKVCNQLLFILLLTGLDFFKMTADSNPGTNQAQ